MKPFPVRVLGLNVLLRRVPDKPLEKDGIIIPQSAASDPFQQADVLAVGAKVTDLKPGDRVVISRHADRPTIPYNGETLDVVPEGACLIRIEGKP